MRVSVSESSAMRIPVKQALGIFGSSEASASDDAVAGAESTTSSNSAMIPNRVAVNLVARRVVFTIRVDRVSCCASGDHRHRLVPRLPKLC